MSNASVMDRCRACGAAALRAIVSLGNTPLANALLTAEQLDRPEPVYPLDLVRCDRCYLVQIKETVSPELLFKNYPYFSSYADALVREAKRLVESMIRTRGLDALSLVVEVASNDGYLLQHYRARGIPVLGIEPAANVASVAQARGIRTVNEFFGLALAKRMKADGHSATILHANNVLAHVAELNGFVEGLRVVLDDGGLAVIEVPYVRDLLDRCEFDTIYHEHLCYFSLTALDQLFARHRLAITDVQRTPIHGGSLRLFLEAGPAERSLAVRSLLEEEDEWGVSDWAPYARFAESVRQVQDRLVGLLSGLKRDGRRIAAYGAAAKGATLLNSCAIGTDTIEFVVDRNVHKQGRYLPGAHIPIHAPERLLQDMPDYVLLLTWNFAEEILAQQADYRRRGGRFVVPIPQPAVLA
jgi:hypothetical protein